MELRPYNPGDEDKILELFQVAFQREMPKKYWEWRFRANPAGLLMIELAWDGSRLVGHYALSPVTVRVGSDACLTALSMTTMTHPDFRGQGIFVQLAERLYARTGAAGCRFVWGFPNFASHRGFVRDLKWTDICEVSTLTLEVSCAVPIGPQSDTVQRCMGFDERFDEFRDQVSDHAGISVVRDRKYLEWRFCQCPTQEYEIFTMMSDQRLIGFAVCKSYNDDVDLVHISLSAVNAGTTLVSGIVSLIQTQRKKSFKVRTWLPVRHPLHTELEKMGFRLDSPVTYFGAKMLTGEPLCLDALDARNWHFAMSDSDVY